MQQKQNMDDKAIEKKKKDEEKSIERRQKEEEKSIEKKIKDEERATDKKQKDEDKAIEKKIMQEMKAFEKRQKEEQIAQYKKDKIEKIANDKLNIVGIQDGDDNGAVNVILENYPHRKYCNQELYVFDNTTGMWSTNRAVQNKVISGLSDKLNIYRDTKDGKEYTGKNYADCHNKRKDIYGHIHQKTVDDDWVMRSQLTSLGKILFTNGIYDFRKSIFISSELNGFDPEIVFYCRIDHDFKHFGDDDMEYIETIKNRLFHLPLGKDVGNYVILNLARGLAGDMMKRAMFGLGMSNTGKGIMTKALQLSCGQYVDTFNAENLAYTQSSNDEAQKLRWALLLRAKRIIISNEMTNNKPLNGNILKKVCSGGDTLIARLHAGLETPFVPQFLSVLLANDIPEIKPYDDAMINRVRVYTYTKTFVDEPQNEFELKKDPELENEMQTHRFQRCFVGLLLKSYLHFNDVLKRVEIEPDEVMMAKKDWMGDDKDNNIIAKFQLTYELTNDLNHHTKSKDIETWVASSKEVSYRKFVMELKKYVAINNLDKIKNDGKKIGTKNVQGWYGIKLVVETNDDDEIEIEEVEY
jgi:phage/plasmid-associated DNA primase